MKNHESLWLVWQNINTRLFYHIGTLSFFDNQYTFQYTHHSDGPQTVKAAINSGYLLHPKFPDLKKVYKSTELFSVFKRRLPSEIRADFKEILNNLNLSEDYSYMELLERTRGKLAGDQYSFEKPLKIEDGILRTSFYVNGMSYQNLPENWYHILKSSKVVELKLEPENEVDENAIAIYTSFNIKLGYVPRFYNSGISALIKNNVNPKLAINYINESSTFSWWVKLDFECEVPGISKNNLINLDPIFESVV